jgi:hypothetical protein
MQVARYQRKKTTDDKQLRNGGNHLMGMVYEYQS